MQPPLGDTTGKNSGEQIPPLPFPPSPHLLMALPIQQTQLEARGKKVHTWNLQALGRLGKAGERSRKQTKLSATLVNLRWGWPRKVTSPDPPFTMCPHVMLSFRGENQSSQYRSPNLWELSSIRALYLGDFWLENNTLGRCSIYSLIILAHP